MYRNAIDDAVQVEAWVLDQKAVDDVINHAAETKKSFRDFETKSKEVVYLSEGQIAGCFISGYRSWSV